MRDLLWLSVGWKKLYLQHKPKILIISVLNNKVLLYLVFLQHYTKAEPQTFFRSIITPGEKLWKTSINLIPNRRVEVRYRSGSCELPFPF